MVPLLCCHWDFSGIFLSAGVFARYCQIIWKSIVHERIVFQKVFFLFFAINNFQTIGGRVSLLSVALAAQGSEVPDLQLLTASHWPSSSSHCISVGNWTGLLVTSNTFPKEVLGLRCLLAFHWHDLRWIFCFSALCLLGASSSGKADHVACLVKREIAMTGNPCSICRGY